MDNEFERFIYTCWDGTAMSEYDTLKDTDYIHVDDFECVCDQIIAQIEGWA